MKRIFVMSVLLYLSSQGANGQTFCIRDEDSVLVRFSYFLVGDKGDTLTSQNGCIELKDSLASDNYRLMFKSRRIMSYDLRYLYFSPKGINIDTKYSSIKIPKIDLVKRAVLFLRTKGNNFDHEDSYLIAH